MRSVESDVTSRQLPAFALALALLIALAAGAIWAWMQLRMAPAAAPAPRPPVANSSVSTRSLPAISALPSREVAAGPGWETLTTRQKLALYPLAERWSGISEVQKRRWLALAQNFAALPAAEQSRLHERMTDWASLSAQQRTQARLNYAATTRLAPDTKREQWEAYLALSEDERNALAARAPPKPLGAATALRPASNPKLAQVPAAALVSPLRPNAPKIPPVIDQSPRVAAPVTVANPATPEGSPAQRTAPAAGVETAPVSVPTAVPADLPPLPGGSGEIIPPGPTDPAGMYAQ